MAEELPDQKQDSYLKKHPCITPIVKRICEIAHPEKIIVFGSVSRGDDLPESYLDILIIKSGNYDPISLTGDIYVHLHGIKQAVDIVLCSPEDIEKSMFDCYSVISPAIKEGKVVYEAKTAI